MIYFYGNDLFTDFEYCSQDHIEKMLQSTDLVSIDIETGRKFNRSTYNENTYKPGLDPFMSRIVMVQLYDGKDSYIIDARVKDISFLKKYLEDDTLIKIGHNLQFECKFFKVHLNAKVRGVWDTMICEKVLYNGALHSYTLAALADRYLNKKTTNSVDLFDKQFNSKVTNTYKKLKDSDLLLNRYEAEKDYYGIAYENAQLEYIDKSTRMGFVNIGDRPFSKKEILYGAADVIDPWKIYHIQKVGRIVQGEKYNPDRAFRLQNKVVPLLAEMCIEGISLDKVAWTKLYEKNFDIYHYYKSVIDQYIIDNYPQFVGSIDLFNNEPSCAINWGSSKQVIPLFKLEGKCPQEFSKSTKRKEYSVGATALFKLLTKDQKTSFQKAIFPTEIKDFQDFILAYLVFKKAEQLVTTFGLDWMRWVHPITHKIHSNFNQYMNTGRMSSTSPNMTNIPAPKEFRSPFHTDTKMICCDYASQESRLLAEVSGVPLLIKFFVEGDPVHGTDMHCFIATMMYQEITGDPDLIITKKTHPEERDVSKALNFKMSYGGSAYSLKDNLSCSEERAEEIIQAWFDSLPGLQDDFKKRKRLAVERGWIELDPITKARYFYPYFEEMQATLKEVNALKPEGYDKLTFEEKQIVKEKLREETNWSELWRKYLGHVGKLERKGLNFPLQGRAACQTKTALIYCDEFGITPLNIIHDEILAKYEKEGDELLVQKAMEDGGNLFCKHVKMLAQPEIADYWKH